VLLFRSKFLRIIPAHQKIFPSLLKEPAPGGREFLGIFRPRFSRNAKRRRCYFFRSKFLRTIPAHQKIFLSLLKNLLQPMHSVATPNFFLEYSALGFLRMQREADDIISIEVLAMVQHM
jgi:hypothetical protein